MPPKQALILFVLFSLILLPLTIATQRLDAGTIVWPSAGGGYYVLQGAVDVSSVDVEPTYTTFSGLSNTYSRVSSTTESGTVVNCDGSASTCTVPLTNSVANLYFSAYQVSGGPPAGNNPTTTSSTTTTLPNGTTTTVPSATTTTVQQQQNVIQQQVQIIYRTLAGNSTFYVYPKEQFIYAAPGASRTVVFSICAVNGSVNLDTELLSDPNSYSWVTLPTKLGEKFNINESICLDYPVKLTLPESEKSAYGQVAVKFTDAVSGSTDTAKVTVFVSQIASDVGKLLSSVGNKLRFGLSLNRTCTPDSEGERWLIGNKTAVLEGEDGVTSYVCLANFAPFYFPVLGGLLMILSFLVALWTHGTFVSTSDPRERSSIRNSWVVQVVWIVMILGLVVMVLPG